VAQGDVLVVELRARLTQICILAGTTSSHAFLQGFKSMAFRRRVKLRCKKWFNVQRKSTTRVGDIVDSLHSHFSNSA
jgi:hypothetical protein